MRNLLLCVIAASLLTAGCGTSTTSQGDDNPAPQTQILRNQDWVETGYWPYDHGYGFGIMVKNGESISGESIMTCEKGAQALIDSGAMYTQPMVDAYIEGCDEGYSGQAPDHIPLESYGPIGNGAQPAPIQQDTAPGSGCDPNYDGACVPVTGFDLDCPDIQGPVYVIGTDIHGFDREGDGIGCE